MEVMVLSSTKEDRLPIIKSCLDGLHRGEAEPLFIGDIDWAVAEIERLRAAINDLLALIKNMDAEANNVQLDIARVLRRHHMDA